MDLPIWLVATMRDTAYLVGSLVVLAFALHFTMRRLGSHYSQVMEKLDGNPLAIGIFLGLLAHAIAGLIVGILH